MALSFGNTASNPSTPNMTFVRGQIETTLFPTPASTMINAGDLLLNNAGVAAVMSAANWDTSASVTQGDVRPVFLGVAAENKLATDASTRPILVYTKGVFTYPCAALGSASKVGERVAAAADGTHNLKDQTLAIVTNSNHIGSLVENAATGATSLVVYIQSDLIYGAIPAV